MLGALRRALHGATRCALVRSGSIVVFDQNTVRSLGSIRIGYRSRHTGAAAAEDGSLERHFVENDLAFPLTPPKSQKELRSAAVEWIWNKAGGDRAKIVESVKAWSAQGNPVTRELINSLLIKLSARLEFLTGYQLLCWVRQTQPYELTDSDTLLFLHFSSLHKRKDKSKAAFKQLNEKKEHAYTCFIRTCSNTNDVESAEAAFKEMKEYELLSGPEPYNLMVGLYLRLDEVDKAKHIFSEMESSGIAPNPQTYKTLLGYRGEFNLEGLAGKVRAFLDGLADTKLKGEDWKNAILLYASTGRSADVQRLWKEMLAGGYVPDHYYFAAAEAFSKVGDMKKFEELCTQVASRNGTLSEDQCYRMVKVYSDRGHMDKAEAVFEQMVAAGYNVGFRVYHFLVEGYMTKAQPKKALEKFNECLRKGGDRGFKTPTLLTVLLAMQAYAQTKDVKAAEKLVKVMRGTGTVVRKDTRLYNALLKVYIAAGQQMFEAEERLRDCGISQNDETCRLLKEMQMQIMKQCSA